MRLERVESKVKKVFPKGFKRGGPLEAIKDLSRLLGFAAIFMSSSALGSNEPFFGGGLAPEEPTWHLRPFWFPLWEVLFFGGGLFLVASSHSSKRVVLAHTVLCLTWLAMGVIWVAYGIILRPDYVFTAGVMGVFMAAQHALVAKLWIMEAGA